MLGLRAGPRDKSKKGTVTGVVRFKLKKNAETGAFEQVAEDEEGAAAGPSSAAGVKGEEGDEDAKMAASDPVKGEDDEASNLGSPALASSKKLADEPAPVEQEMPSWEKQYWEERRRADNTPGFVEWEAVSGLAALRLIARANPCVAHRSVRRSTTGALSPSALPRARTRTRSS